MHDYIVITNVSDIQNYGAHSQSNSHTYIHTHTHTYTHTHTNKHRLIGIFLEKERECNTINKEQGD